jgi:hypothetical protein
VIAVDDRGDGHGDRECHRQGNAKLGQLSVLSAVVFRR